MMRLFLRLRFAAHIRTGTNNKAKNAAMIKN